MNKNASSISELDQLKSALNQHAIVSVADVAGNIIEANDKFCEVSGYSRDELIGKNHRIIKSTDNPPEMFEQLWSTISSGRTWQGEIKNRKKDGSAYWVETTIVPFLDANGLPSHYVSIRTEITHIIEAEIALQKAKDEAERACRAKSDFLSQMSHEFKTPLNAILGFAQLLESEASESQKNFVQPILKSGWHLLQLINEILDLSKIESGHVDLSIENVDLRATIRECMEIISGMANQKAILLINRCDQPCFVHADKMRLKQVLLNLLSNAVKYNRENGSVTISAETVGDDQVKISIQDTGRGLSADQQNNLFQPFNRLGAEKSRIEGTGIGLIIAKKMVEMMGGSIEVQSTLGEGSTFWIALDKKPEAALPDQPFLDESQNYTILYVEDNPENIQLISHILARRQNIRLLTAHNGELGLDLAVSELPDLIILDINIPGMNGFDILRRLALFQKTRNIPVFALSANTMPRDIEKGIAAGFSHYITKPIRFKEFLGAVDQVLIKKEKNA